jgi:hypothetical protein
MPIRAFASSIKEFRHPSHIEVNYLSDITAFEQAAVDMAFSKSAFSPPGAENLNSTCVKR